MAWRCKEGMLAHLPLLLEEQLRAELGAAQAVPLRVMVAGEREALDDKVGDRISAREKLH